ncbi:MAG TPA: BREX system ATP-binding domain-containing protein [Acetobacteraceae bacterium]|jgi:hypothetical protein|nr:BREX system ATP-binding domain-containing protein [Acetobacteraceae bacterium]
MPTPLAPWLALIEREYLASFIPAGGGALRFVVAEPPVLEQTAAGLRAAATQHGLASLAVDSAVLKLQHVQTLFFAMAQAVDWEALMQHRLEVLLAECGYAWPQPGRRMGLAALAAALGVLPHQLRSQISQELTRAVWGAPQMAQDFRYAMIALLEARLAEEPPPLEASVLSWLRGDLRRVAEVRPANIGARVSRHSARAMLISLCHWVRACGGHGLLVLLDIRQLLLDRRAVEQGVVYTPAAVMDCYEVLRQTIDDTERFEGVFFAVLADPALLDEESRRGLGQYTALKMRVWDDVRPHGQDNMLAPLVVLQ